MILSNPTLEMSLIATCLNCGTETARAASASVVCDDFVDANHRSAWQVITALVEAGEAVDTTTFDLRWPKVVEGVRIPPVELWQGLDKGRTAGELDELVANLKEWTRRRSVHAQALKLAAVASNPKADLEAGVADCQTALRQVPQGVDREFGPERCAGVLVDDLEARHKLQGALSGMATGFATVDDACDGLQKSELSIIGARPNAGKSALLLGIANHIAFSLRKPVLFYTLEMSIPILLRRLASLQTAVGLREMKKGRMTEFDFKKVTGFTVRLKQAPLWFYNGVGCTTCSSFRNVARRFVQDHGIELVMVDYLQKIQPNARQEKRTYEVAEACDTLTAFAIDHAVHVCSAAQLNREVDKATGKDRGRPPRISDLADSSQIEKNADLILLLNRAPDADEGSLIMAKQRDGEHCIQHLWFDKQHCRFYDTPNAP